MKTKIYQVDAFADKLFSGNPAAVCPLQTWLDDKLLQSIAMENNLAETAFYVKSGERYEIRWFTPAVEVDLCGHATLATAFVLFNHEGHEGHEIEFYSHRSGVLKVAKNGDWLTLDFPTDVYNECELTDELLACFNHVPLEAYRGKTDFMLVFGSRDAIETLKPNYPAFAQLPDSRGVIVTAPGTAEDFVSRFFAPQAGINEDPVTGSAHTTLTPYWSKRLGKAELTATQLSARGGLLKCTHNGGRIMISGQAVLYMTGEITL